MLTCTSSTRHSWLDVVILAWMLVPAFAGSTPVLAKPKGRADPRRIEVMTIRNKLMEIATPSLLASAVCDARDAREGREGERGQGGGKARPPKPNTTLGEKKQTNDTIGRGECSRSLSGCDF